MTLYKDLTNLNFDFLYGQGIGSYFLCFSAMVVCSRVVIVSNPVWTRYKTVLFSFLLLILLHFPNYSNSSAVLKEFGGDTSVVFIFWHNMDWPLATEGLESVRITCMFCTVGSHISTILLLTTFYYLAN